MEYDKAVDTMTKFKKELEQMKGLAQPGDTMPAEVFFTLMNVLIPAFDAIIKETVDKE